MELQQLVYFQNVAHTEHMGDSAESLHISQPALSMSIKALETELGVPLFDRVKKSIVLNDYGRIFLKYVEQALDSLSIGRAELDSYNALMGTRVVVMCPPSFMSEELMTNLYKEAENIVIENKPIDYNKALKSLTSGEIDFCVFAPLVEDPQLVNIPLTHQSMGVVLHKDHPLANRESIHIAELASEYFATYPKDTPPRINFEECCKKAGFTPRIIYEATGVRDILNPVRAKYAVALLVKESLSTYEDGNIRYVPLAENDMAKVTYGISYCGERPLSPIAKLMIETIVKLYKEI